MHTSRAGLRVRQGGGDALARACAARVPAVVPGYVEPVDVDALFAAVAGAARRPDGAPDEAKAFADGKRLGDDMLPNLADGSFAGYAQRVESAVGDAPWFFFVTRLEDVDADVAAFTRGVLENYRPGAFAQAEIFLGRYPLTPGNVHKETCANHHVVLFGAKSMLVWEDPAYFAESEAARAMAAGISATEHYLESVGPADLERAAKLDAAAGDVIYWPASLWHVGRSPARSLALNVAVYDEVVG